MATLLEVVQTFAGRQGIDSPATVYGSTDVQVLQIMGLLNEGLLDLVQRGPWERLTFEASWTTTATESQGALTTLASKGFGFMLPSTFWDRTERLPLLGSATAMEWQALKGVAVQGPRYTFRVRGGELLSIPAPPAGHTWVFEYVGSKPILDADGVTYRESFSADDDDILLPTPVVLADLRWRWKKEKGLVYDEDFNTAERMIVNALGRSTGPRDLQMDGRSFDPKPGIFIPAGNWPLP